MDAFATSPAGVGPSTNGGIVSAPDIQRSATVLQTANVRSAPSMSGAVIRTLTKGSAVYASRAEGNWLLVQERDGSAIGWVYAPLLKFEATCSTC